MSGRGLQPCGTRAAYMRHIKAGEEPDQACREANADYGGRRMRARQAAYTRLAAIYPDDFARFLAEEQAVEGITTEATA